ncbi:MAG: effector-associated domain EAD1-containing protein [Chloroflexota bacterium]
MSQLFPLLDKRHVIRLLRGAFKPQIQEMGLRYSAQQLARLGIITIDPFSFIKCTHPADEDYPQEILDLDCEGLLHVDESVHPEMATYHCPLCGRFVEYPSVHKEVFHSWLIQRNTAGIAAYVADALSGLPQVHLAQALNEVDIRIQLKSSRILYGHLAGGGGTKHRQPDGSPYALYIQTYSQQNALSSTSAHPAEISLVDLLTHESRWVADRFQEVISPPLFRHRNRADLQSLQKALLDAFPTHAALAKMIRIQLNRPIDALAMGNNLDEIIFRLINRADQEGWHTDLIRAAKNANPTNIALQTVDNL